jgi:hypothetical protein
MGVRMQGIHALGPVHGDGQNMAVPFGFAIFGHFFVSYLRFFTFRRHPSLKYPCWPVPVDQSQLTEEGVCWAGTNFEGDRL